MTKVSQKRNGSKLIILAMVLLLPGFLYIMVNKMGSNEYVKLPVYGEKSLSGKTNRSMGRDIPDTLYHTLSPIQLTDSNNKQVTFLGNDTAVTVVHLFYSKDKSSSKPMMDNLAGIAKRFIANPVVELYSISVDPNDTPEDIKAFANYPRLDAKNWFVTTRPNVDIFEYAQKQMLIDAMKDSNDSNRFIIASKFLLIDSKHRIRGFYDINLQSEIKRLEDEIKLQLVEEIRNKPLKVEQK
ncbi:photosynthetic protein synthase I [Sphingobacterium sp. KB22]|uniref:Photosynthetic protein synthase I n=2 Tax=Sphingobacterium hungaricum TaxID=2082723 RepID=A0A928YPQ8_9SPHI|nr:photosynthetic protein synthase I [Sphingobacterium hungaricum]